MAQIAPIYRKFVPQLLHMIVLPVFFFTFMLVYRPFDIEPFLGSEWFGVHLTIISCIVLFCAIVTRTAYYFIPMRMNYALYLFWCLGEIILTSFFVALYIWLVFEKSMLFCTEVPNIRWWMIWHVDTRIYHIIVKNLGNVRMMI